MKQISETNYLTLKNNLLAVCQMARQGAISDKEKNQIRRLILLSKKL